MPTQRKLRGKCDQSSDDHVNVHVNVHAECRRATLRSEQPTSTGAGPGAPRTSRASAGGLGRPTGPYSSPRSGQHGFRLRLRHRRLGLRRQRLARCGSPRRATASPCSRWASAGRTRTSRRRTGTCGSASGARGSGCHGILQMTLFKDASSSRGAGVGGGSLVYANTLLVPPDEVFADARVGRPRDWSASCAALRDREAHARRRPRTRARRADDVLKEIAEEMGRGDTFHPTDVAVYFGEAGRARVPDPYFGGEGPERTGCIDCGGCMVGCRFDAKNTLDKNYLYLAEKHGATIQPETRVVDVERARRAAATSSTPSARRRSLASDAARSARAASSCSRRRARHVKLLLKLQGRAAGLPKLSRRSSATTCAPTARRILGVHDAATDVDFSQGHRDQSGDPTPTTRTHIEPVRYSRGLRRARRCSARAHRRRRRALPRWLRWLGAAACTHPIDLLRGRHSVGDWAEALDADPARHAHDRRNHMQLRLQARTAWSPRRSADRPAPPGVHPRANEFGKRRRREDRRHAANAVNETVLDMPTTAHILGGCVHGRLGPRRA